MGDGVFVTFEGPEGSGKSSQIKKLYDWLVTDGRDVVMTREPGGTCLGEQIRDVLNANENISSICPLAELMMFEACRAQHMHEKILPALYDNKIVLCDRFIDSSTVYQGLARNIGADNVNFLNMLATSGRVPDLTFVIDVPVDETLSRLATRGKNLDRIEKEGAEFFNLVRDGYLKLSQEDKRFFVIDGTRSIDSIAQQIKNEFRARFL